MVDFTKATKSKGCLRWLKEWLSAVFSWFWSAVLCCFGARSAARNDESYSETDRDLEGQEAIEGDDFVQLPAREEEEEVNFIPDSDRDFRVPKRSVVAVRVASPVAKPNIPGGIKTRPAKPH